LGTGITVYPPPIADFTSTPDTGVLMKYTEALVSFTNLSQGATSYAWNFSDGTTSSETNPVHQFLSKGEYMVRLTATSDQGCTAEKVRGPYLVEGMPPVYVPNSFTPNNDGLNDVFKVYAIGLKEFDLKVFDRWGTQVFNSNDITIGWDGTFNGKPLNAGVYIYQLRAILQNDDPLLKYGDVNLLR
jgi:gliding motility-associated-like protein